MDPSAGRIGDSFGLGHESVYTDLFPNITVSTHGVTDRNSATTLGIDSLELLQSRPSDIARPELNYPELYRGLREGEARKEFEVFWQQIQAIKAEPNAQTNLNGKKIFNSIAPLKLNSLRNSDGSSPNLTEFFKEQGISVRAILNNAELNDAQLNRAQLNDAELNDAQLNDAQLNGAQLNGANLFNIEMNNDTKLGNINVGNGIWIANRQGGKVLTNNTKEIKKYFIDRGAKDENISFKQAA